MGPFASVPTNTAISRSILAVIVLLVFIVIQRRPWIPQRKRVASNGTWFPPSFFFPSTGGNVGQTRAGPHVAVSSAQDPRHLLQLEQKTVGKSAASQMEDLLHPVAKRARYTPSTTDVSLLSWPVTALWFFTYAINS